MSLLYVFAKKNKNGSVDILKPQEYGKPALLWLTIEKHHPMKPDYRHKKFRLNYYTYPIFWIR